MIISVEEKYKESLLSYTLLSEKLRNQINNIFMDEELFQYLSLKT